MRREKTRTGLALSTVLGMLVALLPLAAAPATASSLVAFDMVGSASQNLIGHTNPFAGAFGSAGDGFEKYQRGVSPSIPFSVLDDSLSIFTGDSLGVIKEGNTDVFFGVTDTENGDNSGPVSASWEFDVAGAGDLALSIDMGAMGDFESSDTFVWEYSFDGGPSAVAFANTVDEAGSYTYTLEGGASFPLDDPMLVNGTILTNDLATFTAPLVGSGSTLTLTLTASTDGGSEAFVFQNLIISGAAAAAPLTVSCGVDQKIEANTGLVVPVSAIDADDVASLDGVAVTPTPSAGSITLANVVPASGEGAATTADVVIDAAVPGGVYEVTVSGSNLLGESASCSFMLNVVGLVAIHDIQGAGDASPMDGAEVIIEGVVVGDFQGRDVFGVSSDELSGFFVQEQDAETDGDPLTSEGLFVYAPGAIDVALGDVVTVRGYVDEFRQLTQIAFPSSISIDGVGSVTETAVSLPVPETFDWETLEGMLVTFPQDLYINEFFNYDRHNEIVLGAERHFQPTNVMAPGPAAAAAAAAHDLARITIDDGRFDQNPDPALHPNGEAFTLANRFRGGDILRHVTGILNQRADRFGSPGGSNELHYRIDPTVGAIYVSDNPRGPAPDVGGSVKVASFNVLNFFTHVDDGSNDICGPLGTDECRGADNAEELQRQLDKIVAGIIGTGADVVGLQEIENDIRDDEPVYPNRAHDPVLTLVEALNAVEGPGTWEWAGEATYYNNYPVSNEIIYKPASVTPIGGPIALQDIAFDAVRPGSDDPVGRPPLAQTFADHNGEIFTVVTNHFKSKGSGCDSVVDPDTGLELWSDPDLGDGQANCNLTRVAQSLALLEFVADLQAATHDDDVLIIGDLNSYAMEDPISALEGVGFTNLLAFYEGADAYTYVFDGRLGNLDHALGSASILGQVTGTAAWHINSDEPDILDYDTSFKRDAQDALYEPNAYRASDHDPVIVGLDLTGAADFMVDTDPESLWPPNHKYREVMVFGEDADGDLWVKILDAVSSEMDCCYDEDDVPDDIVIIGDSTLDLRAERYTEVDGRIYSITVYAWDGDGQALLTMAYVHVPHDQRDQQPKR